MPQVHESVSISFDRFLAKYTKSLFENESLTLSHHYFIEYDSFREIVCFMFAWHLVADHSF